MCVCVCVCVCGVCVYVWCVCVYTRTCAFGDQRSTSHIILPVLYVRFLRQSLIDPELTIGPCWPDREPPTLHPLQLPSPGILKALTTPSLTTWLGDQIQVTMLANKLSSQACVHPLDIMTNTVTYIVTFEICVMS